MNAPALDTLKARQIVDTLAPCFLDHLCSVVRHGRFGIHAARESYLVESVLRDEGLIATMWGNPTPLGTEVARIARETGAATPLATKGIA